MQHNFRSGFSGVGLRSALDDGRADKVARRAYAGLLSHGTVFRRGQHLVGLGNRRGGGVRLRAGDYAVRREKVRFAA